MSEPRISRESVQWLILEGTAIIASILLAFAIDAWWEDRTTQQELREHLLILRDDFAFSLETIAERWEFVKQREKSIVEILDVTYDPAAGLDLEALDTRLGHLMWHISSSPIETGGLDGLIASGLIDSIGNLELRKSITLWPGQIRYLQSVLSQDYDTYYQLLAPYLVDSANIPQIFRSQHQVPGMPDAPSQRFPLTPNNTMDHNSLLRDAKFQNVLAQIWAVQHEILAAYSSTHEFLNETIEFIDAELGSKTY